MITGLSGSGKSSLAFDTIYAEGQRRYVESLSAYARQFLGQMDKPDVDSIEGLSPAISIDQSDLAQPALDGRTVTEIYDYLRLLCARVGKPHCHICGRPITGQSAEQIIDQVMELPDGDALHGDGADRPGPQGRVRQAARRAARRGLHAREDRRRAAPARRGDRARQEVQARHLDRRRPAGDEGRPAQAAGRLDRDRGALAAGWSRSSWSTAGELQLYSEKFACPVHGPWLVELEPRIFCFNSPHGACPRCTGLGSQMEIDPDLVVPDPARSIGEGAIAPWAAERFGLLRAAGAGIAERYGVELNMPWADLPEEQRDFFLYGTNGDRFQVAYRNRFGRRRNYTTAFEGIVKRLERRYRETESEFVKEKIEEYMTPRPCPDCKGARLRAGGARGAGRRPADPRVHGTLGAQGARLVRELELSDTSAHRAPDPARDRGAAEFPGERRRRLPSSSARPRHCPAARRSASGWPRRSGPLVGVLYILDEPRSACTSATTPS